MINNNLIYSKEGYLKLIRKKVIVINTYKLFKQDLKEEQNDNRQTIVNNIYSSFGDEVISINTNSKKHQQMQKKGIDKLVIDNNYNLY